MLVTPKGGSERTNDFAIIEHTPAFLTLNLKLAYNFYITKQVKLEASAGVQNMLDAYQKDLDKGASRASDYVYGPTQPRSLFLGGEVFVLGIMSFFTQKTVGRVVLILCIAGYIADVVIENVVHYAQTIS